MRGAATLLLAVAASMGAWTAGPALPVARSEVAVAVLGNRIFVIGGYADGNVDQRLVQVFNPHRGVWRDVAQLPRGLNHVAAVGYKGQVYVFGGFAAQNSEPVNGADVYDPSTNR
jgi:N-acetylneuraminic acid mutarotase